MDKNFWDLFDRIASNNRKIKLDYDNPENIDSKLCKECGGKCCIKCGCHFSPRDFKEVTFKDLQNEIKKGYISIEWVDGEIILRPGGCYILRVRNEGKPIVDNDYQRTHCILWTEDKGCKLDYENRPAGGRLLVPKRGYDPFTKKQEYMCYSKYEISNCCDEWMEYQEILRELVEFFRNRNYPCSI